MKVEADGLWIVERGKDLPGGSARSPLSKAREYSAFFDSRFF